MTQRREITGTVEETTEQNKAITHEGEPSSLSEDIVRDGHDGLASTQNMSLKL